MRHWRPSEKVNWQRPGNSRLSIGASPRLGLRLALFAGKSSRFSGRFPAAQGGGTEGARGSFRVFMSDVTIRVHKKQYICLLDTSFEQIGANEIVRISSGLAARR